MQRNRVNLIAVYNQLHSPLHTSTDVLRLRDLHSELDYVAASAYGWDDLDLGHGFHETKQGIRFTISQEARREVLDRLLELNHQRHAEEVSLGLVDESGKILKKNSGGTSKNGANRKAANSGMQPALALD